MQHQDIRKVFRVGDTFHNQRLDRFLESQLELSRSQIKRLIDKGFVFVSGERARKPGLKVKKNEEVLVIIPPPEPAELLPKDMDIKVYYEDEYLAVIEKPAGIPVHPAAGHRQDTLANALIARFPAISSLGGKERPGIVHRLDKNTSGLLVVAKTEDAHMKLSAAFKEKRIVKGYVAICCGRLPAVEGIIDAPIGRHPVNRKKMAVVKGGREAFTAYRVIKSQRDLHILAVRIYTGRTHQIRVHLHHIGCPVIGDETYGKKRLDLIDRQALHATYLRLVHPETEEEMEFFSVPPNDMARIMESMGIKAESVPFMVRSFVL